MVSAGGGDATADIENMPPVVSHYTNEGNWEGEHGIGKEGILSAAKVSATRGKGRWHGNMTNCRKEVTAVHVDPRTADVHGPAIQFNANIAVAIDTYELEALGVRWFRSYQPSQHDVYLTS